MNPFARMVSSQVEKITWTLDGMQPARDDWNFEYWSFVDHIVAYE